MHFESEKKKILAFVESFSIASRMKFTIWLWITSCDLVIFNQFSISVCCKFSYLSHWMSVCVRVCMCVFLCTFAHFEPSTFYDAARNLFNSDREFVHRENRAAIVYMYVAYWRRFVIAAARCCYHRLVWSLYGIFMLSSLIYNNNEQQTGTFCVCCFFSLLFILQFFFLQMKPKLTSNITHIHSKVKLETFLHVS